MLMQASKIRVSPADWDLAKDKEIILTKNRVMEGVEAFFKELGLLFYLKSKETFAVLPAPFQTTPKVSKGEKHGGLPWLMLDYPRHFSNQEGHFAVRCFFWWGNHFSIQFHYSGKYVKMGWHVSRLLKTMGWHSGIPSDPWFQSLPGEDWKPLPEYPEHLDERKILKAKTALPLEKMEQAPQFFINKFNEILQAIESSGQFPSR